MSNTGLFSRNLIFASLLPLMSTSMVFALGIGVNAGVSTRESVQDVKAKYVPFAEAAAKRIKEPVEITPVSSATVVSELDSEKHELMVVHTHEALKAVAQKKWHLVFFTQDTSNNQIYFMSRAADKDKKLADMGAPRMVFPGKTSFASTAARAELGRLNMQPAADKTQITAYQDALTFYLTHNFADVAVTRVTKIAQQWQKSGGGIVYTTASLPVYAVIARPSTPTARLETLSNELRQAAEGGTLKLAQIENLSAPSAEDVKTVKQRLGI
jgi:ABC transporter, phosphonate, periplasmic substrate-binding protein